MFDIIFIQTELSLAQVATSRETNFEINPIVTYTIKRHGRIRKKFLHRTFNDPRVEPLKKSCKKSLFCFPSFLPPPPPGGARWLSGRVSDSGARGPGFETYRRRVVSLSKTLYQEAMAPSRHDWKIVDWDVKPQHNQPTKSSPPPLFFFFF